MDEILSGFAAAHGPADLRIGSTPEGSDLLLDSAVSRDEVPEGAEVLCEEEICLAVPAGHRLAAREAVSLTELAGDPFIALSNSQSFQQVSDYIFQSAGIAAHAAIECDSAALQLKLLSCGMGVALVAAGDWQQADADVRLLHILDARCRRYVYMKVLSGFRTRLLRDFQAYVRGYFAGSQLTASGTWSPS